MNHTPSRACYLRGCRQPACKAADYQYMSRVRLEHHRGERRRCDATQARHHIERLTAAGWTQAQISRATGLSHRTLGTLATGISTISKRTAHAILSVPIGPAPSDDLRDIDPTGTVRRVQALIAIGWPLTILAPRIGIYETALGRIANGKHLHVRASTAATVRALYRDLARMPGPSERARTTAVKRGWVGPAAWDDSTIDDPNAVPDMPGPEPELTRDELAALRRDEIRHLARFGLSPEEIASRLGVGVSTVTGVLRALRAAS